MVDYGSSYRLEMKLGADTEFIEYTMEKYYATCQWSYKLKGYEERNITDSLGACDYPIRSISTAKMTLVMPVFGIPDFDLSKATLYLNC
jgi:hypothetical protein